MLDGVEDHGVSAIDFHAEWYNAPWKKEDEPGFCMNMLAPKRYSPKKQPMKGGLCHWRVFRAKEEAEG